MSLLADVTPLNFIQERDRFFETPDYTYNPQFTYKRSFTTEELQKWGKPSQAIADQIQAILPQLPTRITYTNQPTITKEEIATILEEFFETIGLENQLQILFSADYISRCKLGPGRIMFRTPITYTQPIFIGTIYHEIGTHYLRRHNNTNQPWTKHFRPDAVFRETEEGLATLHTYLGTKQTSFFSTYTSYYGLYLAHTLPFNQAFKQLLTVGVKPERAWQLVLRGKRGIKDTSQAQGGLTKDISYLLGAVKIWQWLQKDASNPKDLYLGRIGLDELNQRKSEAQSDMLLYPPFLSDISTYKKKIITLGESNFFQTIAPLV